MFINRLSFFVFILYLWITLNEYVNKVFNHTLKKKIKKSRYVLQMMGLTMVIEIEKNINLSNIHDIEK